MKLHHAHFVKIIQLPFKYKCKTQKINLKNIVPSKTKFTYCTELFVRIFSRNSLK